MYARGDGSKVFFTCGPSATLVYATCINIVRLDRTARRRWRENVLRQRGVTSRGCVIDMTIGRGEFLRQLANPDLDGGISDYVYQ